MRNINIILFLLLIITCCFAFKQQDGIGKKLFEENCASCHEMNKSGFAPSFKNIRQDYSLKWVVSFLRNSNDLIKSRDSRALCVYYRYEKIPHIRFPVLEEKYISKILEYVDKTATDTSQYVYQKMSEAGRQKFIKQHEANK